MKAKCLYNLGDKLSKPTLRVGYSPNDLFHLNVGEIYTIYGVQVWRGIIKYLTLNAPGSLPVWYPAEIFQLVDYRVPPNWYYKFLTEEEGILNSVMGYQELAMDPKHHDGIIAEEPAAVKLFFERKKEIDKFHQ